MKLSPPVGGVKNRDIIRRVNPRPRGSSPFLIAVGLAGLGCGGGGGRTDAGMTFCGDSAVFQGGCGGTASGTGTTALGTLFRPTAVRVALGAECSAVDVDHSLPSVDFLFGSGPDYAHLTFKDQPDGGQVPFLGQHQVWVRFTSFTPCAILPGGMSTTVTTVTMDGTAEIVAGDDPNTAVAAGAGMLTGTLTFSGAGQSGSGSFSSPYCTLDPCPAQN
jgi:hypothetical protein